MQVSAKKNLKKPIVNKNTTKKKLTVTSKKIKKNKKYYVGVRAYTTYKDKNNKIIYVYGKVKKSTIKIK